MQLSIWDGLKRPGRKTEKPWGCPDSIWATIQKRKQRGKPVWTAHDIKDLVKLHAQRPIGKPAQRPHIPDPPPQVVIRAVETVVFPKGTCSPITARLIQDGKFASIYWCPERGGVRIAKVRALV